jgi:hypothetical protein
MQNSLEFSFQRTTNNLFVHLGIDVKCRTFVFESEEFADIVAFSVHVLEKLSHAFLVAVKGHGRFAMNSVQNWVSKVDNSFFIVWDTTLKEKKGKS